jgi:ribosomal protein L11 methyltransferase
MSGDRSEPSFRRVALRVPTSEVEIAAAWLLERFPAGFEERELADFSELAVYTDEAGEASLRATYSDVLSERVEAGWEDRWKEFHRPVRAGGLWIGPPWLSPPVGEDVVVVDPGRAFGTGAHPTTQACIELLAGLERGSLLDAGCGSGVVAVAAARLGFSPIHAVDVDDIAVGAAADTARTNGVTVEVSRADVLVDELPAVDVIVANIELTVVEQALHRVSAAVAVTSGYLSSDVPRIPSWSAVRRLELEGWAADVLARRH